MIFIYSVQNETIPWQRLDSSLPPVLISECTQNEPCPFAQVGCQGTVLF